MQNASPSPRTRHLAAALAGAALLLGATVGCSTSGGTKELTLADAESLLPTAAQVGAGFEIAEPEEEDDPDEENPMQVAITEQCPEAAAFFSEEDTSAHKAERDFEDGNDRSVTVGINLKPTNTTEDKLTGIVDAVNSCDTIEFETENGLTMAIDLTGERRSELGDRGAKLDLAVTMSHPQLPSDVELQGTSQVAVVNEVAITVEGFDGVDGDTLETFQVESTLTEGLLAQVVDAVKNHE